LTNRFIKINLVTNDVTKSECK